MVPATSVRGIGEGGLAVIRLGLILPIFGPRNRVGGFSFLENWRVGLVMQYLSVMVAESSKEAVWL
jgi:hypothetical protein